MRGTGGNDVNFAMDVPKADSPDIAELRKKGRDHLRGRQRPATSAGRSPRRAAKAKTVIPDTNLQYAPWGGQTCNPYDTDARAARHEQRLRRFRGRQPGDVLDLRAGLGVLQGAGVAETTSSIS